MGCGGSSINYQLFKGSKRGQMRLKASNQEDFLTHHLSNQTSLSQYASTDGIKKRQIIEHITLDQFNGRYQSDPNYAGFYSNCLSKSWMQRMFKDFLAEMDQDYFNKGKSYDASRQKLADRYLFQIYQLREFFRAGIHKIKQKPLRDLLKGISLAFFAINSDSALFPMLKILKQKYPQVADNNSIKFPDVKQLKQDANLLAHFDSKYLSDLENINLATTTLDLKFLFDTAFNQFEDFKSDMQDILGIDVLADVKVKCIDSPNGRTYNASSTRRVLIKWVETLLEKIPEQIYTGAFMDFLSAKCSIIDNFHVKSTVETETTHNTIIRVLLYLIEDFKVNNQTKKAQPRFGFFIYDLLRCKTHRQNGEGVVQLIEKMKATKTTKSGKKLQVMRIKNRLKTPNRDVMVNFRYGDIIVAEAQLGIDSSKVSQKDKKTNKFNHYLYELQRGLFGPTIQLMMQYQDFNRKDVIVHLKIQDRVIPRQVQKDIFVQKTDRKCPVGHELISLQKSYFIFIRAQNSQVYNHITFDCDYCLTKDLKFQNGYDYCYKCSLTFCWNCRDEYKKVDPKKLVYTIQNKIIDLNSHQQLQKNVQANGYFVALFADKTSSASILTTDFLSFMNSFMISRANITVKFGTVDISSEWGKQFAKQLQIKRLPTFVAFDRNCKPRKRLIGASVLHIDWFSDYAEKLTNPQFKRELTGCSLHPQAQLRLVNVENLEGWKCRCCNNAESMDGFGQFFQAISKDNTVAFQCSEHHDIIYENTAGDKQQDSNLICKNCAYLAWQNDDVQYLDVTGQSYLSSKIQKQISKNCKNGHRLEHLHRNPKQNFKLVCNDCNDIFVFSKQDGIGYCKQCDYIMDPKCYGIEIKQLDKDRVQRQLVSHFAEMTASEIVPCKLCFSNYVKQYNSPKPIKWKPDEDLDQDFNTISKAFFSLEDLKWKCYECKQQYDCKTLHLVCSGCQIQYCLSCAMYVFNQSNDFDQNKRQQPSFKCPSGHQTIKTSQAPDYNTTKYLCVSCQTWLTINSPNHYCEQCNQRYCQLCGPIVLKPQDNTCFKGHQIFSKVNLVHDYLPCALNPNHIIHFAQVIKGVDRQSTIYCCQSCQYYTCHPQRCKQPLKICSNGHVLRLKKQLSFQRFCKHCKRMIDPLSYECQLCQQDVCFRCYKTQQDNSYF